MGPLSGHCEIIITSILQDNFDLFFDIISFQHVLHFDVGRSEIEWNMKLKMEILCFYIGPKVHKTTLQSLESTTVLSDTTLYVNNNYIAKMYFRAIKIIIMFATLSSVWPSTHDMLCIHTMIHVLSHEEY